MRYKLLSFGAFLCSVHPLLLDFQHFSPRSFAY